MAKYVLDVMENWHRRYLVEVDNEDDVIPMYAAWLGHQTNRFEHPTVEEIDSPEYIDDAPYDSFIVEPYDE